MGSATSFRASLQTVSQFAAMSSSPIRRKTVLGLAICCLCCCLTVHAEASDPDGAELAWESRRGKGRYYTRSRRVGPRVVREYVGTGPAAEDAAARDAERRAERLTQLDQRHAGEIQYQAAIAPLLGFCRLTDQLLAAALAERGYHRHARGAWRRKRDEPK